MKNKKTIYTIWIIVLVLLTIWEGGINHIGWGDPSHQFSFLVNYITGSFAALCASFIIGLIIYRLAKKKGDPDPMQPTLGWVSIITIVALVMAVVKYNDVMNYGIWQF